MYGALVESSVGDLQGGNLCLLSGSFNSNISAMEHNAKLEYVY